MQPGAPHGGLITICWNSSSLSYSLLLSIDLLRFEGSRGEPYRRHLRPAAAEGPPSGRRGAGDPRQGKPGADRAFLGQLGLALDFDDFHYTILKI